MKDLYFVPFRRGMVWLGPGLPGAEGPNRLHMCPTKEWAPNNVKAGTRACWQYVGTGELWTRLVNGNIMHTMTSVNLSEDHIPPILSVYSIFPD